MSVKTVRFNTKEEMILKKVLCYYKKDFSTCMKELILEKLEDLRDINFIKHIKEGKREDYLTAQQIDSLKS